MELSTQVQIWDFNDNLVQTTIFQLLQWQHAMCLEAKGMKLSRGSVTAHVRRKLSTPKNFPREQLIEHVSNSIASIKKQLETGQVWARHITRAQRVALKNVWERTDLHERIPYREFRKQAVPGIDNCIMVQYAGMWLGIERDGYTHS